MERRKRSAAQLLQEVVGCAQQLYRSLRLSAADKVFGHRSKQEADLALAAQLLPDLHALAEVLHGKIEAAFVAEDVCQIEQRYANAVLVSRLPVQLQTLRIIGSGRCVIL